MKTSFCFFALLLFVELFINVNMSATEDFIRRAAVAGAFYPANKAELRALVEQFLDLSSPMLIDKNTEIRALVAPHAGYVFSGAVAGRAYRELCGRAYNTVIIISPSHSKSFAGASVFAGKGYETPLGVVKIDNELAESIAAAGNGIKFSNDGHETSAVGGEHSLEVQLPFLQVALPETPIVAICMGSQSSQTQDRLMKAIVNAVKQTKKKVLIVASSDLSHFHNVDTAFALDSQFKMSFEKYDYFKLAYELEMQKIEACGGGPVVATMLAAEQLGSVKAVTMQYATSADSPEGRSSRNRVVGYLSGLIIDDEKRGMALPKLNDDDKNFLLDVAKKSVERTVAGTEFILGENIPDYLKDSYAVFVTMTKNDELRACMGHAFASSSLIDEIMESAKIASTMDWRFGPIKKTELSQISYEITILSRMKRITDFNEIQVGRDGLYIHLGNASGLLLPQVAEERNWDRITFLKHICQKAGLRDNDYKNPDAHIYVFNAIVIH